MAKTREVRNRIRSVSNTMKITRTMEMVATVKSKQAQVRLRGALPYNEGIDGIVRRLLSELDAGDHPLFEVRKDVRNVLLLAVASNRGFCGGFNTNVIHLTQRELANHAKQGRFTELHVSGKKAISFLKFQKVDMARTFTDFDDKVTYKELEGLATEYMNRFTAGEIDQVLVVGYRFASSSRQEAKVTQLLPLAPVENDGEEDSRAVSFLFDPPPRKLLAEIVPFAVKTSLFTLFLEAATSEQIARRMAMKLATDNATDMIKELKSIYNRARQDQITMELLDILGGTAAIEG